MIAMYCTQCGTQNHEESKFCRECGFKIPPAFDVEPLRLSVFQEIVQNAEAPEEPVDPKLKQLLDMAFWHKNAGNARGAILACEAALIINPDCTSALSLLGCLYEETGRDEDAIVMFERIVALNPASTADREKLELLRKGVKIKAVKAPGLYRWTPPALAEVVRERRISPGIGAAVAVVAVLGIGGLILHAATGPRPAAAAASQATSVPVAQPTETVHPVLAPPTPSPAIRQSPAATTAAPQANPEPFAQAALAAQYARDKAAYDSAAALAAKHRTRLASAQVIPPLPNVNSFPTTDIPSVIDVRPLRAVTTPRAVPNHVIHVSPGAQAPQHTVIVGESQGSESAAQTPDDPEQPAPPQSQIEISVRDAHSSGADGHGRPTITLSEDPGAALQQKALSYQQESDYPRASAAYQTAIGAYQQEINAGRNVDEARRGIAACQTGLQICKQSQ